MQELLFNEIVAYEKQLDFNTAFSKAQEYMKMYPDDQEAKKELEFLQSRIAQENVEEPAPEEGPVSYTHLVRRPDGEIELKVEDYKCTFGNAGIWRKPLIRGVVSFVDSLVVGTRCLMYSAEIAGDEEDEKEACLLYTSSGSHQKTFFRLS